MPFIPRLESLGFSGMTYKWCYKNYKRWKKDAAEDNHDKEYI
jgi:hypothetical protein